MKFYKSKLLFLLTSLCCASCGLVAHDPDPDILDGYYPAYPYYASKLNPATHTEKLPFNLDQWVFQKTDNGSYKTKIDLGVSLDHVELFGFTKEDLEGRDFFVVNGKSKNYIIANPM